MPATVMANALAVATKGSLHNAHSLPVDVRLVPPYNIPTPLPNFILSKDLARKTSKQTTFNGDEIWIESSECGGPPPSQPADGFVGAVSGKINSYAKAAPGAGSPNVFVEGEKVICFTNFTLQNGGNSPGMINNAAGLALYLKQFEAKAADAAPADAEAKSNDQTGEGAKGEGEEREKEPEEDEDAEGEEQEPQCGLNWYEMTEDSPGAIASTAAAGAARRQHSAKETHYGIIEVVGGGNKLKLTADPYGNCDQHPLQHKASDGWVGEGNEVTWINPPTVFPQMAMPAIAAMFFLAKVKPKIYTVKLSTCDKDYTKEVRVFPRGELASKVEFGGWASKIKQLEKWLGNLLGEKGVGAKLLNGSIGVSAAWGEGGGWQCYCDAKVEGECVLIELQKTWKYGFERWPIPIPAVKAIQLAYAIVNDCYEFFTGKPLVELYLFLRMTIGVAVKAAIIRRTYWTSKEGGDKRGWRGTFGGEGKFTIDFGIGCDVSGGLVKAECFVQLAAVISFEADIGIDSDPGVECKGEIPPVKFVCVLSWDFKRLAARYAEKIPLFGSWLAKQTEKFELSGEKKFEGEIGGWIFPLGRYGIRALS